uniref:Uncharacterized protein n=1 Tax=Klebsiella pneumoniae TaxID=573 RepID=A0A5P1PND3_KLEPN|nr:hypothetical protein [Klebsiella pneumoniae]
MHNQIKIVSSFPPQALPPSPNAGFIKKVTFERVGSALKKVTFLS